MREETVMGFIGYFIALVIVCLAVIALRFTWFVVVEYPSRPDAPLIHCEAKP